MRFVVVPLLLAAALVTGAAHAEPSAADRDRARGLVFEGRALRRGGDTRAAIEKFRAAHAVMGVPTTGIELGEALVDLGLLIEARDVMLEISRMPVGPKEPVAFGQAREEAARAAEQLSARIPSALIVVNGFEDAAVVIDGQRIDRSLLPLPRKLNPGSHTVVATSSELRGESSFTLAEREARTVTVELRKSSDAPIHAPAVEATISPARAPALEPARTSPLVFIGFGAAILGAATGGIAGGISLSKTAAAREVCDGDRCPPATRDDLATARTTAWVANVAVGVAVLGAALGIVGLVLPSRASRRVSLDGALRF